MCGQGVWVAITMTDTSNCSRALLPRLLPRNKMAAPEENGRSECELDLEVSPLGLEPRTG